MTTCVARVALALLMPAVAAGCSGLDAAAPLLPGSNQEVKVPVPPPNRPADTGELSIIEQPEALLQRDTSTRRDPFARFAATANPGREVASSADTEPAFCPLRLTGFGRMNGESRAFVEGEMGTGHLQEGDVGGKTTGLLAPGLRVGAIDVASRQLRLNQEQGDEVVCEFQGRDESPLQAAQ